VSKASASDGLRVRTSQHSACARRRAFSCSPAAACHECTVRGAWRAQSLQVLRCLTETSKQDCSETSRRPATSRRREAVASLHEAVGDAASAIFAASLRRTAQHSDVAPERSTPRRAPGSYDAPVRWSSAAEAVLCARAWENPWPSGSSRARLADEKRAARCGSQRQLAAAQAAGAEARSRSAAQRRLAGAQAGGAPSPLLGNAGHGDRLVDEHDVRLSELLETLQRYRDDAVSAADARFGLCSPVHG
jgi:hypothetical protein